MSNKRVDKAPLLVGGFDFVNGNSKPLSVSKSAPVDSKTESDHQVTFFDLVRRNSPRPPVTQRRSERAKRIIVEENIFDEKYLNHPHYIFTRVRHFPNGGLRHSRVAEQLKAEGVRPGAWDIQLDAARSGFNGLRIEMKAHKGELSDEQNAERLWLDANNYSTHICWHYVEAFEVLCRYCGFDAKRMIGYPSRHAFTLAEKQHDRNCGCCLLLGV